MSYALPNVPTVDAYSDGATLLCGGASQLLLTVANAAVVYQLGYGIGAPLWDTEQFAIPGVWTLPAADAIRCRSGAPGTPAQVAVTAV